MFVQNSSIRKLVNNTWILYQAEDPYYTGELQKITIRYENHKYVAHTIFLQNRRQINCKVVISENGLIQGYRCNCENFNDRGCVHLVATCNFINEIEPTSFPYELDYQAYKREQNRLRELELQRVVMEYQNQELMKVVNQSKKDRLSHLLSEQDETIHIHLSLDSRFGHELSFSIGTNKLYKVKDIPDLVLGFAKRSNYDLGKTNSVILKRENLDSYSELILDFLTQYISKDVRKTIEVNKENIDSVFGLASQLPSDYYDFYIDQKEITIPVTISKQNELYTIEYELDSDLTIGHSHLYKMENRTLTRYQLDSYGQVARLVDFIRTNRGIKIKDSNMKELYLQMIEPNLQYFDLTTQCDLDAFHVDIKDIKIYSDLQDADLRVWGEYLENGVLKKLFMPCEMPSIQSIEAIIENYANKIENNVAILKTRGQRLNDFLDKGIPLLMEQAQVYVSEELMQLKNRKSLNLNVGVHIENNLLEMRIDTDDVSKEELIQILNAYRKKKKFFRLKNGQTIDLESKDIEQLDDFATQMDLSGKDLKKDEIVKPAYQMLHLDNIDFEIHKDETVEAYANRIDSLKEFEIDSKYDSLLRDYQKDGIRWISHLNTMQLNGILADDMGLGKTLQVLVYLDSYKSDKPHLIVCPSSLMYNWDNEIHKFNIQLDSVCVSGAQNERTAYIHEKHDLYITTYDYLKRDIKEYVKKEFEYVILDEAQYIKNPKTQNAQCVKSLQCSHRLALTGTPIENSLSELWSIFDFLMPGYLYSLSHFTKNIEKPIRIDNDTKKQEQLKKLVSPFILRRTKQEVLKDLPDKVEKEMWLTFSPEEKNIYLANLARANEQLQEQFKLEHVDSILILALMTRLRQICCDARMLYEDIDTMSTKMSVCLDLIETLKENNKKVLLFSSFTSIFDNFIKEFNARGIKYHMITGQTSKEKRRIEVDEFQSDDSDVFLISLKAGGTGLNLTAAQAVIHFDPWWNISAQNQATDRAYRIGQTKNVLVYQLLVKGTIEEKIYEMQQNKKEMSDMFVEGAQGTISSLSKQELKELFEYK